MSLIEYHKSTSRELLAVTDKVRNLINHWGEDGRYKEAILKNVIQRFIPEKFSIGTGFVIKQTAERGQHLSSTQIDLLIYDDASPVLFKEGDFVILTPDAVKGIIEVKANVQNQGLEGIIRKANENGRFIYTGKKDKPENFFNGIFSYAGYPNFDPDVIARHITNGNQPLQNEDSFSAFKVNHISFNENLFLKYWPDDLDPHSLYNLRDLSYSFFISNLVDMLSNGSVEKNNFIWFANDKELNLERQF